MKSIKEVTVMSSFKANTINELEKLFLKKKTIVFLIIIALTSFLSIFFISSIQSKLVFISMSSVSFPLMVLSMLTNIFLPLFIFMAAAELFPGEIAERTLKLVLTKPISRLKVYMSKITAISIYIIINLLVVFLVTTITALILNVSVVSISHVLFSYMIDIVPALILVIFAVFVVQFFKTNSAAIISCILIFLGIRALALFITGLNNNVFTSYLNWYSLWFTNGTSFSRTLIIFLLLLSYGIIFFTSGYYMFDKKEI
jgi:ABC-2 type transport system permease protein